MASQVQDDGTIVPPPNISAPAPQINLRGFHWTTVDEKYRQAQLLQDNAEDVHKDGHFSSRQAVLLDTNPSSLPTAQASAAAHLPEQLETQLLPNPLKPLPAAPPFPLTQFQGTYAGNGFNTIFRPRPDDSSTLRDKVAERAEGLIDPVRRTSLPDDNILELNFTTEQLTFGNTIGDIPNRGFGNQPDIVLSGLPYLQTIQDATDLLNGKAGPPKGDIHFEPGMWLAVPSTKNPAFDASIVRMASIPHGTTIHAQGIAPPPKATSSKGAPGGPQIDDIDITPVFIQDIGNIKAGTAQPFPSMTASDKNTARLPQNLEKFIQQGTITDAIIKNPNLVLKKAIQNMRIVETITFEVSTGGPKAPLNGGGTANISFLLGSQAAATATNPNPPVSVPNAHAAFMSSKFWIETVEYSLNVGAFTSSDPQTVKPIPPNPDAPMPTFLVMPPTKIPTPARTIKARGIQIQYSQTVNLIFGPLKWPHVSVASLVPTAPQVIQMPA